MLTLTRIGTALGLPANAAPGAFGQSADMDDYVAALKDTSEMVEVFMLLDPTARREILADAKSRAGSARTST